MSEARLTFAALLLAAVSQPALAQSQPAMEGGKSNSATSNEIETIVVTAQRRSENLQNVPIAVSVITAASLQQTSSMQLIDINILVPSINLHNSAGYLVTSLRGVGSTAKGPGVENPIALYVDGVYYPGAGNSLLSFNNIDQIEVLRGPQGTLFGRNATGGLIQIKTRTPGGPLTGDFNVGYGNYNTVSGQAYVGGELAKGIAADIALTYTHQGNGWGTNLFNGRDVYKIDHDVGIRSKWVFGASDRTRFTVIGDYAEREDSMTALYLLPGTISSLAPAAGGAPVDPKPGIAPYNINTDAQPFTRNWSGGVSARWDQEIGDLKLMNLSAWRKGHVSPTLEFDGTSVPGAFVTPNASIETFTHEIQLSSGDQGRLKWTAGGFYINSVAKFDPFHLLSARLTREINVVAKATTQSVAGYGQASYEFGPGTTLTLGGRYTWERRRTTDTLQTVANALTGAILVSSVGPDRMISYSKFTFRGSLDHRLSDQVMAYASVNRGFKSGGFNVNQLGTPAYLPETLDAYEAGLKMDLLDRRLRFNLAGFYYNYTNLQVQRIISGATIVINAGVAKIYGVEGELTAKVTDKLTLTGNISLLNPKYTAFEGCLRTSPTGGPTTIGSCTDNTFQLAARTSFNMAANYRVPLGRGTLDLNANLYYNGGFFTQPDNAIRQGNYALVGASARYKFDNGLMMGVFGRNLTNKPVITNQATSPEGNQMFYNDAPRTYGVSLGYSF